MTIVNYLLITLAAQSTVEYEEEEGLSGLYILPNTIELLPVPPKLFLYENIIFLK